MCSSILLALEEMPPVSRIELSIVSLFLSLRFSWTDGWSSLSLLKNDLAVTKAESCSIFYPAFELLNSEYLELVWLYSIRLLKLVIERAIFEIIILIVAGSRVCGLSVSSGIKGNG